MDKTTELLAKIQKEFKFDRMIIIGLNDEIEQMHFMQTANITELDATLIMLDAIADLATATFEPSIMH